MRELTDRELDAVGGGLALGLQFGFLAKQVQNTANNSSTVTQGLALANIATVTQTNVQVGQIF